MTIIAIIPARYASTRFPAKPLALLGGRPIIEHVYRRVNDTFKHTFVATDNDEIRTAVEAFGGRAIMTSPHHRSGTDRCYEAYTRCGIQADVIVNVQGDEPFIAPSQLATIAAAFEDPATDIATLARPFPADTTAERLENPNTPKVVISRDGNALYFSRSVVPYLRGVERNEWAARHRYLAHIGLYAYRADALKRITTLPAGHLETAESLEQLRWLEEGLRIKVGLTDIETIGIDTPEDLARAEAFLNSHA